MDAWEWILSLGVLSVIIGLVAIGINRKWIWPKAGAFAQSVSLIVGIVFVAGGLIGMGMLPLGITPTPTPSPIPTAVVWDVSDSETQTHLVPIAGINGYECRVTYNSTSLAIEDNTEFIVINFTIERDDQNTDPAYTTCEVTNVGTFTAITGTDAGDTKDLIVLAASGDYDVDWTKNSGGATGVITDPDDLDTQFPRESDHRDGWVSVNITINPAAIGLMAAVGDNAAMTLDIAETLYTITVRLNTLNT